MTERVCHVYKIGEVLPLLAQDPRVGLQVVNDAASANATAHGMLFSIAPSAAGPTY